MLLVIYLWSKQAFWLLKMAGSVILVPIMRHTCRLTRGVLHDDERVNSASQAMLSNYSDSKTRMTNGLHIEGLFFLLISLLSWIIVTTSLIFKDQSDCLLN